MDKYVFRFFVKKIVSCLYIEYRIDYLLRRIMWFSLYVCISSLFSNGLGYRVLHSGILGFLPELKLHHLVVLSPISNNKNRNNKKSADTYVIDFSPLDAGSPSTLLKLALAMNVPAETRLRVIRNGSSMSDSEFIGAWHAMNPADTTESLELSNKVYRSIRDRRLKTLLDSVFTWNNEMNLYTHNCQHFSAFVSEQIGVDPI
jgi:hypothetical protein